MEKVKVFLMGVLVTLGIFILLGAGKNDKDVGAYEMAVAANDQQFFVMVMDTRTGKFKLHENGFRAK